ncbi:hypothetical protein D6856_10975 [Butyrivibrio sp. XB500-5]|uniref:hypothetical protein n=1 Tax=Butyrivibrio sp. XB500-5 TaxID=2364880 RepID=UPI000EA9C1B5|nr:hypothetical protein [Butyrivibrio sp. XB500-5]RKM58905.1 hypothetical protein D6856_10975 [Butyrivibrio sp. XB500-5]
MSQNEMYIDNFRYTGIVNEIKNTAASCNLSAKPLESVKAWNNTDVGKKMKPILESVYEAEELYKKQTTEALPAALFELRDSILATDKAAADSVKVDNEKNGE